MATIGEIMAAKDPNFKYKLNLPWGGEEQPDDRQPATPTVATPDARNDASGPPSAQGQPTGTGDEIDKLIAYQRESDQRAEDKINRREVGALMSQGARDPNKILTSDAEDIRKRPLEMYKARIDARKQAAEAALQAAQGRHYDVESANIPIEEQRKQSETAETGRHNLSSEDIQRAEERGRGERSQADIKSREGIAKMEEQGRQSRFTPYEGGLKTNPITGEEQTYSTNRQTGQVQTGGGSSQFSEGMRPVYEHYQAKRAGTEKDLTAQEAAAEELPAAREAVKQHPESFSGVASWLENKASLLSPELGQRLGAALRGEAGTEARTQALNAAASRIHEIAGTRGFSKGEQQQMAQLTVSPSDSAELVMSKLKRAEELNARALARTRSTLPVNVQHPRGSPQAQIQTQVGRDGKKYAFDGVGWKPAP